MPSREHGSHGTGTPMGDRDTASGSTPPALDKGRLRAILLGLPRAPHTRERDEAPEPGDARLGDHFCPRQLSPSYRCDQRASDEAAASVEVLRAQGAQMVVRAVPSRMPTERHGTHAPDGVAGQHAFWGASSCSSNWQ